jgi:two-component system chemotaxis response regulator CheY
MFPKDTKILIVDDLLTMRKVIQKCLSDNGLRNVMAADDGVTGWQAVERAIEAGQPFQLILSDWNMPIMNGTDFLKKARAHPVMKDVPFIIVTTEDEKAWGDASLKAGASSHLVKPFSTFSVTEKLKSVYAALKK